MSGFSTTAAFPNALMWLMSEDDQELVIPEIDGVANFWTSQNAWGVAVQHDAEGEVELTIGPNPPEDSSLMQLHEGILHTGRRLIDVQTVSFDSIAKFRTRTQYAKRPRSPRSLRHHGPGRPRIRDRAAARRLRRRRMEDHHATTAKEHHL